MDDRTGHPGAARIVTIILAILFILPLVISPAAALMNPAAVYCGALGYTYTTTTGSDGSVTGYCTLPNNQNVEEWGFLQGKVAPEYSYCAKQGYKLEVVSDPRTCAVFMTDSCAVCVLPDGSKTEVTKLMNLSFRETLCSNGFCCYPNSTTCTFSNITAPGSSPGGTPGTTTSTTILSALGIGVIIVVVCGLVLYLRKKKGVQPETKP
jgi:putative hemolysin